MDNKEKNKIETIADDYYEYEQYEYFESDLSRLKIIFTLLAAIVLIVTIGIPTVLSIIVFTESIPIV